MQANEFWEAAQAFRAGADGEDVHQARVTLIRIALEDGIIGQRAADILRLEGIAVVRGRQAAKAKAL